MKREERNGADGIPYQRLLGRMSDLGRTAIGNLLIAVMIVYIGGIIALPFVGPLAAAFSYFEPQPLVVEVSIFIVALLFGAFAGKDARDSWGHYMCLSGVALYCTWAALWSLETGALALGFAVGGGVIAWGKRRYLDQIVPEP